MKLLADECVTTKLFREFGSQVQREDKDFQYKHLLDFASQGVPDDVWIPQIAREGYVVVTGDRGRGGGPRLPKILPEFKITGVYFAGKLPNLPGNIKISVLHYIYQNRTRICDATPGTRFKVYFNPAKAHISMQLWPLK